MHAHSADHGFTQNQYLHGMERLVTVVQELSLARDLATIQRIVRTAARELTGADGATFVLRDNDKCFYADEDAIDPLWKGMRFPMEVCVSGWAMLNRSSVAIEDIYQDARVPADAYRPTFVKSLAMVPIRTLDPVGAIGNYWALPHRPSAQQMSLLQALADTTAVAMENVTVYGELEDRVRQRTTELRAANEEISRLSLTDELTGLRNRRGFFLLAGQERKLVARTGRNAFVMAIDLDGLKRVNDSLGHEAGDALLRAFAGLLDDTFREPDVSARLGGDEFCVFGLDSGAKPHALLRRLDDAIDAWNAAHPSPFPMAASAGVWPCRAGDAGTSLADLLAHADRLMYARKRDRRKPA